ncbi:MAG: NUDIX domain-containing protein [Akkermansiaceae bacterium]|nr:NUDIX domain-containing protein [Armatimonadota bacterium]
MTVLLHVSLFIVCDDRVLLVQEADPEDEERWNLPGGNVEPGEAVTDGAVREALEETGLSVTLTSLVGVYSRIGTPEKRAIRFVFRADNKTGTPTIGDGVLAVQWLSRSDLAIFPDEWLLGNTLRRILEDGFNGISNPLSVLCDHD